MIPPTNTAGQPTVRVSSRRAWAPRTTRAGRIDHRMGGDGKVSFERYAGVKDGALKGVKLKHSEAGGDGRMAEVPPSPGKI